MLSEHSPPPRLTSLLLASACLAGAAFAGRPMEPGESSFPIRSGDLFAQAAAPDPVEEGPAKPQRTRSESVTINLINRLVARGVLTKEDSQDLVHMAEEEAAEAREQARISQVAPPPAPDYFPDAQVPSSPTEDEAVRVTYIPESVKAQMRDEIKEEVLAQARAEKWASPHTLPEWVTRYKIFGDIRVRAEGVYFPGGNDNTGSFPNFNAINTGSPFDTSGYVFSPQLNVDQQRQRVRLRARLGAEINMGDGFTSGIRIATGENSSPVSTNQSLGASGGNFSKYAIWLDRAYLKYEIGGLPNRNLAATVGRFDNPFFSSTILFDDDLGFDGASLQGRFPVARWMTAFANVGAFPVFNTDFNFSSNQPAKFKSDDKYLYGGQAGVDLKLRRDLTAKLGGAYYYFDNIEGRLSDPYTPLNDKDAGNTDNTRPSFAQKGNTYRPLRNIVPNANNNFGTTNQYQYFGLATPFHDLALTARLDYNGFEPVQISLLGEYVRNLAFSRNSINSVAVNNRGPNGVDGAIGSFAGGDTAWTVDLRVGSPALAKRWDWSLSIGYRYVESDSVVDGLTDSDFGGGGTNLEGYVVGGALALSPRVSLGLRWLSATEIAGPPYKNDIIQIDINGKF